jgi:hypothetical protein
MYSYATKICPVYVKSSKHKYQVQPIIDAANALRVSPIIAGNLLVCRFVGLPAAVLAHYAKKYGKTGRELVKKANQMLSLNPIKSEFGDQISYKQGFGRLLISGCWYTIKQVTFGAVMVFPFGLVVNAADYTIEEMESAMGAAVNWLPIKPDFYIKEITLEDKKELLEIW